MGDVTDCFDGSALGFRVRFSSLRICVTDTCHTAVEPRETQIYRHILSVGVVLQAFRGGLKSSPVARQVVKMRSDGDGDVFGSMRPPSVYRFPFVCHKSGRAPRITSGRACSMYDCRAALNKDILSKAFELLFSDVGIFGDGFVIRSRSLAHWTTIHTPTHLQFDCDCECDCCDDSSNTHGTSHLVHTHLHTNNHIKFNFHTAFIDCRRRNGAPIFTPRPKVNVLPLTAPTTTTAHHILSHTWLGSAPRACSSSATAARQMATHNIPRARFATCDGVRQSHTRTPGMCAGAV